LHLETVCLSDKKCISLTLYEKMNKRWGGKKLKERGGKNRTDKSEFVELFYFLSFT
jgi:hypothetical protein